MKTNLTNVEMGIVLEDDCEDCRKERAENNQLIDIYGRLSKMKSKVSKMKPSFQLHSTNCQNNEAKLITIKERIKKAPTIDVSSINQKQMGYELAYALIERQMKIKRQNERMQKKIKDLKQISRTQKRKNSLQLEKQNSEEQKQTMKRSYHDTLDNVKQSKMGFWMQELNASTSRREKPSSRISNNSSSLTGVAENSSTTSSFEVLQAKEQKRENEEKGRKRYSDLNLWLYRLNEKEDQKSFYKGRAEKQYI